MCQNCLDNILNPTDCTDQGCPINLDAACVFYNLKDTTASKLTCVGIPNGTNIKTILEKFDEKLCSITALNYSTYDLSCLRDSYNILTNKQFAEAVAREVCLNKSNLTTFNQTLTTEITQLNTSLQSVLFPNIIDNCLLGIEQTDSLSTVLQKILGKLCEIINLNFTDQSPILNAQTSTSIAFTTSGTKNHNIIASVRIATDPGNVLQLKPSGLFVPSASSGIQILSYDSLTRTISLSNGGGSIVLPVDNDAQTLSFNTSTKILSISGGNTVNLSSLSASLTETFLSVSDTSTIDLTASGTSNHTLSAAVKISAAVGNQVSANPDGLFVPASTVSLTDTDITNILNSIDSNPSLKASLFSLVYDTMCFNFRLENTSGATETYDYVDCTGSTISGVNLAGSTTVGITAKSVAVSSTSIKVYNLGLS